ncbi:hypothetical protein SAMN05421666_2452 [Roseovarius nanhaiticus]|uniref:Transglycosylase associated protein n=1 Tax=Roseovarius nanhaiticus TaxID=573024 RepID=A0A1N7H3X5_9RHOB|nr:hypothetical protein [Roseovarius nanhaiticus]SEL14086.1 hypothetical protein SAMN05216208_2867 [Roseovarius nanhaiticus]SIS19542.1 hypothetical protein SAMN05421666_2452 [Roseovarius nanhaiticus]
MEMLAAMMAGAVGGIVVRTLMRRVPGRWPPTTLGILGGLGAWWALGAIGPGEAAGPIILWHVVAGAVAGGAVVAILTLLLSRAAKGGKARKSTK